MKLNLLDIDGFITKNKVQEVTSPRIYVGGGRDTVDPNGLFSEEIFGRLGSRQRKSTFGYIDLKCTVIHPEAYSILTSLDTELTKFILDKEKYKIENGTLVKDQDGLGGVFHFIQNIDKLDFKLIAKNAKNGNVDFISKNKKLILINKFPVLPAGVRDIQKSTKSGRSTIQYSEITNMYEKLMKQTRSIVGDINSLPEEISQPIVKNIQRTLLDINSWIKERLKSKHGLIRGGILKKVTDYSGRMVITPDIKLKMGYVGVPWQIILKLFEPFAIHHILYKDKTSLSVIQNYMNSDQEMDVSSIRRFITKINNEPDTVQGQLKEYLLSVAEEIAKEKMVTYKRDPVENRDSWICAHMRVDNTGYTLMVNPLDLNKNGGDFDGDACSIFAILTDEAQEQAKNNMNPRYAKSAWYSSITSSKPIFSMELDASAAIYAATKV